MTIFLSLTMVNDIFFLVLSIKFCHWLWSMTFGHKWYVHNQNEKSMILCIDQLPLGQPQNLSLTGQWQFWRQSDWDLVKAENHWLIFLIMDIPLMAKCHLPQSMTKIYGQNFKKNVIDDGQWQKKLSFTERYLSNKDKCQLHKVSSRLLCRNVLEFNHVSF